MKRKHFILALVAMLSSFSMTTYAQNVAKVGNTEYATIDEAIDAWTNNTTLTLLSDVTLSDVIELSSTEYHTLDLGTYTMTAASKKDAIQIVNNARSSASYALDIKADAENPGGITATGKAIVRTTGKSGVKDRPIIRFYNGVFNASYIVYHSGSNGTNCPQFQFHNGVFNGTIYTNRALNQFYGGVFTGSLMMSVDSSAYTLIAGGSFKQLSNMYMSALNSGKFTIGSAKGVYDKEVYVDDNGNYVIAAAEPSEGIEAAVAKTPGTNDYLAYSKVATEGALNYTDVYMALEKNNTAEVTVHVDKLDLSGSSFKGTIVVPEGKKITIVTAEGVTPAWTVTANDDAVTYTDAEGNELVKDENGSFALVPAVTVDGVDVVITENGNSYDIKLVDGATFPEAGVTMTFAATGDANGMAYVVHEHEGKNYIYVGKVGTDDKISFKNTVGFSTFTVNAGGLTEAVAAAQSGDIIVLMNGEYELPLFAGKELTFVGESKEGVIVNDAPAAVTQGWNGSTFHFENLTAKGATGANANYHGLANGVKSVTYKDCNINGLRFLYATESVSFDGCAFNANGVEHSFWTYGASNITVKNSTFTYTDRAVNCYSESGAEHETDITFEGCSFTYAGTADAPEGAVEINSGSVKSINLTMNDCTAPAKGAMWFNSQWDSKKGENTVVKVDDVIVWQVVKVAKIGETKYATLEEAFAAAAEGETITLLADATPALTSQRAITKAAVIDLGDKTMTLTEDDLYFGTTTFKNGTIVVDPSVKPSTAVFWMFANQTLTFDNVKIVATGVTGTYLIGLEGENSDLNLLNGSEILVENTTALDLDIICVNGTNTCDIKVENSKVNVTNLDGRVFFRGNYTVKDSEVSLAGITKAGFRIEAGQTLSIEGNSVVNITGEPRDGGIHLTDLSATYTKAETATVNATVNEPKVAKVGENTYRTLALAVAAVEDGGTITLIANETFTENNRYNNGGWWEGLGYSGDKSFTIDLANFTISQDGALNDYLMWFKNDGAKANTITLKNGTLDAGSTAFCALATASSNAQKITVNLENIKVINNKNDGSTVKVRGGAELNVKAGTVITGKDSYLGIECIASTANIYEGAEIYMNGTSSYNGCLAGVGGNGTINVYGGKGTGVSGGFIAMTSGGTINVEGGEWIANNDGTYANSNKSVLVAQSDKQYNAGAGNSIVNVTGGTFKGGYNCYGNAAGDAQINIKGGNFNANPTSYVAEDYIAVENNGVWNVVKPVAKIGEQKFATLEAAFNAVQDGETITLVDNVTISAATAGYTDGTYTDGVRYTGDKSFTVDFNGKTVTDDGCVNDYLIYINNKGEKASEITFTNGTIVSANGCWSAVCVNSSAATQNVVLNLNGMNITNSNDAVYSGNPVVRVRTLATVNVNDGTIITSNGASYGVAANTDGSTVNINEGATIVQQNSGTTGGNSVFAAVGGKGVINIKGGTITSDRYGVHTMTTGTPVINISGGTITAPVALKSSTNGGNGELATINVTGGTINGTLETYTDNGKIVVSGGTFSEAVAEEYCADGFVPAENADGTFGVVVDPAYGKVAKVGDEYFATLQEAINAAQNDETVVLLNTITLADADMVKTEDNRNVMLNISNKSITLDLNENTINIDYNGGQYLFAAVYVADGAGLTVTGNGKIDIAENGINVAYMFWKRGTTGYLTIENGTFHMDDSGDSMVYTNGDEIVTVNGGTFTIDNIDTRPNQFPCIFNAAGQNTANIIVNGGTFNDDVAHQYYPFEVMMPREKALKKSESENLWTVVDAVAYVAEKEGQYINEVGYATLAEAITAAEAGETVTILAGDFTQNLDVQKAITVAGETDAEGNNLVNFAGKLNITADGATVKNINVNNGGSSAGYINAKNVTVDGCQVVGGNGFRSCYTKGTVTFKNSVITGGTYGIHFDGSADGNIVIDNCTITGWTSFAATITKVTMKDTRFDNGNYNYVRFYQGAELTGCSFNEEMNVDFAVDGVEVTVADCTVDGDRTVEDLFDGKDIANSSITVDGVKLARIAKIGDEYYETITAAINAAADGATVEILAGEHSEYVAPWVGDTQHQTEKSITIVGAADFGTVLTGGMYLGYDDSQCREHNIVVKGIAFQGKGLTVACQQNVTIEDNKFTDITEGRAIAVIGKDINSVVKNNVIENVASIGIELRNTLTATVEGNTISGTGHNALQITSQVGSTASTATVLDNTMSDWGVNGEGRAMRFEGIVTATVNGNVMTHTAAPEEFAKITNTTTLDASANYWNGVSPMTSGMFTGVEGDPIAVLKNYYTDAEKTNLVEFSAAGSAACIGSAYFETLAAAITAAQANDVITFLTDINESVTVNKSVTIDGADKTLTGKITTKGSGATLKITIKNITFDGNNQEYDYAVRADNNSKLVIENCSADNYSYGFLYANKTNDQILVKDVTVKNANYGAHLVSINKATFENVTVMDGKYGVMIQNQGSRNVVFNNCTMTNVETPLHVWEKGTANITFAFEGTNEMGVEQLSNSQYAVYKNAAMVGTTVYGDLNDAAAAAAADGTVTLLGNMAIESDLNNAAEGLCNIAADAQVTIDLNGKTIDVTDKSAGNFIVFYNYGDLTIKNGTVNLVAENNRAWNAQSTIILNRGGELTIKSGTYKHLGGTDMAFALDNSGNSFGDAYATIVDGTLESTYTAIRNRMADPTLNGNPGNGTAELTIQGGLIKGVKRGIWGQITNASSDFLGSLTVTGGTIEATDAIRMDADSHENITVEISDEAVIKGNLVGDYADYNVTGGTFYNEVEEGYLAWGYQLVGDAAPYTVAYTGKVSELTLVDGEFTEYTIATDMNVGTLTYKRASIPTTWTPFYVPFEVDVKQLADQGFEVAYINGVRRGDKDDDGVLDNFVMEVIYIHGGNADGSSKKLRANYPYFIRTKGSERKDLSIVLEGTTLYAAENATYDCTTMTESFEITGNNSNMYYSDFATNNYGVAAGSWYPFYEGDVLKPFRFYMTISSRGNSDPVIMTSMSISVRGEEREDGTTFIYDVEMDGEQTVDYIYDLQGRRVLEPQKGGLYIVNGKKVIF